MHIMMKHVLPVIVMVLSMISAMADHTLSSDLTVNNPNISDNHEQAYWKQQAEMEWRNRHFESSLYYIRLLWDSGIDDPYYDLLACSSYFIIGQYETCISKGLQGFKKLDWSIHDEIPDLYTEFTWCDVMWAMGGAYTELGKYEEGVLYLEKLLNYKGFSDNKTLLYYEEKLLLYYKIELCYRKMGDINKSKEIIRAVKESSIFALIYDYWKQTGETKINDNTPYLFYEYVMHQDGQDSDIGDGG